MLKKCICCQKGKGTIEGDDKGISPALVWRTCSSVEKETAVTSREWPSSVLRYLPVAASHSRTVLSPDADATSWPSGEKATALTQSEWPSSVLRHLPVAASHSRTVLSPDADATNCPSGEKATALTREEWPSSVLRQASQSASFIESILTLSGTWSTKVRRIRLLSGANTSAEQ
jgi:hypothetical protein